MFTIISETNGTKTTCKNEAHVKRILRIIVKQYGGRTALKGIYIEDPLGKMWYAEDIEL